MTRVHSSRPSPSNDVSKDIENHIKSLKSLADYSVRELVQHSRLFGVALREQRLETNQIRKFLDAINQIKAKAIDERARILADKDTRQLTEEYLKIVETKVFNAIESDIVLLKPKLAYAATRQNAVEPLQRVMSAAIDKTYNPEDFKRLVQLIESIIAYHKGGN
ncbi:type III-A CRISPR-associated protein Csm2 [Kamptonema cortianum]|nr:type III-A CRISPR-associated protein Csm2 [Geitlerinema splendidum]MDK3157811.1 type III-A CRISPR-associated protein Csm2 [Kamptonema cortianum]